MKIADSMITMQSQHSLTEVSVKQESVRSWDLRGDPEKRQGEIGQYVTDQLQISKEAREALKQQSLTVQRIPESEMEVEITDDENQKIKLLETLLSYLTGKKVKLQIPQKLKMDQGQAVVSLPNPNQAQGQVMVGWGFAYNSFESYHETEKLAFQSSGIIKTADGREIQFELDLRMSREFYQQNSVNIRAGDAVLTDPLVINFDAPAALLTNTKFSFDLDCDGQADQISFTNPGSGFLSLDANNDGKINDGSELFGPQTGNGFEELAKYDQDQNGWIDENDQIFDKLRIWTKDAAGNDQLFALGAKGVGAIYLGNVAAQFGLKNEQNQLLGQAQKAGIFVRENGTVGTVQQVDLVV